MTFLRAAVVATLLTALSSSKPIEKRVTLGVAQGIFASNNWWNPCDAGSNSYTQFTGNGSQAAGWPGVAEWASYGDLWCINQHIIARSCSTYYNVTDMSTQEMQDLNSSISQVSQETQVDHRFILAAVMQETKGCVRAASSTSQDGIDNPGLLQDFKGTHSCNDNGTVLTPCPFSQILGMLQDGVGGTAQGNGYAQDINNQANGVNGIEYAQGYYRAARLYNSGAIDNSGDLGLGSATHCYSSDIANRLTGWTDAPTACTLDGATHKI